MRESIFENPACFISPATFCTISGITDETISSDMLQTPCLRQEVNRLIMTHSGVKKGKKTHNSPYLPVIGSLNASEFITLARGVSLALCQSFIRKLVDGKQVRDVSDWCLPLSIYDLICLDHKATGQDIETDKPVIDQLEAIKEKVICQITGSLSKSHFILFSLQFDVPLPDRTSNKATFENLPALTEQIVPLIKALASDTGNEKD